eukprot:gene27797-33571_t
MQYSASSSSSCGSSLDSFDDWDVSLYQFMMPDDIVCGSTTSEDSNRVALGNTYAAVVCGPNKRPRLPVNEQEIKKIRRKRRSTMTKEERKKEDKDAEKKYQFTFSRLLHHDIRRYIAQMHINTVNSPDAARNIHRFFHDFAVPTVSCRDCVANAIYALPVKNFLSRDEVIDVWIAYVGCHPDGAGKLLGTQIVRKYNSKTSEVRMTVNFRGTYEKVIDTLDQPAVLTDDGANADPSSAPIYHTTKLVEHTPVNVVMYMTFHMNADQLITNIELNGRFVPDPTLKPYYVQYKAGNIAEEVIVQDGGVVVGLKEHLSDRVEEVK